MSKKREYTLEESVVALKGGTCESVAVSTTSAVSSAILSGRVVLYSSVECFFRQGSGTPVALATGVDQILPASTMLRVVDIESGNKLAFKTASGTGKVYIAPAA